MTPKIVLKYVTMLHWIHIYSENCDISPKECYIEPQMCYIRCKMWYIGPKKSVATAPKSATLAKKITLPTKCDPKLLHHTQEGLKNASRSATLAQKSITAYM